MDIYIYIYVYQQDGGMVFFGGGDWVVKILESDG